jgi:hypothetical protein
MKKPVALDDVDDDSFKLLDEAFDEIPPEVWTATTKWLKEQFV